MPYCYSKWTFGRSRVFSELARLLSNTDKSPFKARPGVRLPLRFPEHVLERRFTSIRRRRYEFRGKQVSARFWTALVLLAFFLSGTPEHHIARAMLESCSLKVKAASHFRFFSRNARAAKHLDSVLDNLLAALAFRFFSRNARAASRLSRTESKCFATSSARNRSTKY